MNNKVKEQITIFIDLLSDISSANYEYEIWIPTCIECLQFALDNEQLLNEKPQLYSDTLRTLDLLYKWIVEEKEWAYIELIEKFKKRYTPEEIGKSFKTILERMRRANENEVNEANKGNDFVNFKDEEGNFKSTVQILKELSEQFKRL